MIILLSFTCIFSFLYISFILTRLILFIVYFVYLNIFFVYLSCLSCFLPSLCVDMSDIPIICMIAWCMIALLLCDACIVCLCGTHIYPLTSNFLLSVDLFPLILYLIQDSLLCLLFDRASDSECGLAMDYIYVWEHSGEG